MKVLAGDIGGTKTAVALVEFSGKRASIEKLSVYPSAGHASLEEILGEYLRTAGPAPAAAGFGVAGAVIQGRAQITKLPWVVDERAVSRATGIGRVRVINDFVAAAYGIPYVGPRRLKVLQPGRAERGGPVCLIGAGTGLGEAGLIEHQGRRIAIASEGGHTDFGPRNPVEDGLVRFVRKKFGRVTDDRLLSGEGLTLIYDFLRASKIAKESASVARAFEGTDRAAVISRHGLGGRDRLTREALRLFVSIYGSVAGNLALQYRATGGVFLGGGIAPKILRALEGPLFLESFRDKPPYEDLLARIPVRVVLDPHLPIFGAAAAAY
ncbi:MAG TPA: glucokinase [Thermoanaerobaculia bacterium]|nr:glucokinase [Thermoanaerobaculia bacterium]